MFHNVHQQIALIAVALAMLAVGLKAPAQPSPAAKDQLAILETIELPCRDADGIALGDINGNGKIDILASEGRHGVTLWFEQGDDWRKWTPHPIHTIDGKNKEIEGVALADFNGDGRLEAVALDQPNGKIYLHRHGGDPRKEWGTAVIQTDRPLVQDTLIADIDGDGKPDLVYTWEGRKKGQGGVHWLKLVGDDPLDPAHWQDHVMVQHESAWWLAPRRADLSGNGQATDIVFTARHLVGRNPGSKPGLYWLEPPKRVTNRWTPHIIDRGLPHPLQVDFGDLSGKGNGLDLVVGGADTTVIYWYPFKPTDAGRPRAAAYGPRHELRLPKIKDIQANRVWNVKTIPMGAGPDGILAPVTAGRAGALLFHQFTGGAFKPHVLRRQDYPHPMDDVILLHDITGDGRPEAFIPDSGTGVDKLHLVRFRWPALK